MNGANTDYIQAIIELFSFFITIIMAMIFQIITNNKNKRERKLFVILLLSGFTLLFDAFWYIFDGNTSKICIISNKLCNFAIFLSNPLMISFLKQFIIAFFEENHKKSNKVISISINVILAVAISIVIANIFYPWMYYFDSQNVYHRETGWLVYTILNILGMLLCLILLIKNRKYVSKGRRYAIYLFLVAPFIGTALQITNIGISFVQIGLAIGTIGILISYLVEWIKQEKNDGDTTEEKKRLWLIECIFGIMILFISAAIISCIISVINVNQKNSEQSSKTLSYMVSETIDSALSEPINVSRTMAQSHAIIEALSTDNLEGSKAEKNMLAFMKRIKNEYNYQMIFVASDKTKAYYTYDGLSRYMKVDSDPNDAWYNEYINRNVKYELNIDEDKDNNMELAVFVNMEVRNSNNELIGVCGVATSIESLLEILAQYEKSYDIEISLTDVEGIIQIDSEREKIGTKLPYGFDTNKNYNSFSYEKNELQARLSKYMNGLDWYLFIEDNNPDKMKIFEIILPSILIYVVGVLLMVIFSFVFGFVENKRSKMLRASKLLSESDKLTGIKNRNAYEVFVKEYDLNPKKKEILSTVMIDINSLKNVNDEIGHVAGDELIIGTSKCITSIFGNIGDVYRIGGDEFLIISNETNQNIQEKIELLRKAVDNWQGDLVKELAISIGTSNSIEDSISDIKDLIKLADKRMYEDKKLYYQQTGKNRRSNN